MKVRFWGVRGSYPVPGPSTNRYGGNTSCVEVQPSTGEIIIFDAGTGIRKLGQRLAAGRCAQPSCTVSILFSHMHWDHVQGLPFFSPLHQPQNRIRIYSSAHGDAHLRRIFEQTAAQPYFPIGFSDFKSTVEFVNLKENAEFDIGAVHVRTSPLNHPFAATAYRCDGPLGSVMYASDTAPFCDMLLGDEFIPAPPGPEDLTDQDRQRLATMQKSLVALATGVDLLVYDTHFTMDEYRANPHFGHSAPEHAIEIALKAGAKGLCLFHHAPNHDDDDMDRIVDQARKLGQGRLRITAAREGELVDTKTGRATDDKEER